MGPKKEVKVENNVLWGRPGATLKMGIVGLPNVMSIYINNKLKKIEVNIMFIDRWVSQAHST